MSVNGVVILALCALLASCAATPAQLSQISSQELCIDYAQALLTGQQVHLKSMTAGDQSSLQTELERRHETCSPKQYYLQLAMTRIQLQLQQQRALIGALGAAAQMEKAAQPQPVYPQIHWMNSSCSWRGSQWVCNGTSN